MSYKVDDNTYGIADFQTELLNILREFIKICDKYSLRWWACGGTCIGALRHNGFIPWDDDLDVAMPRPDYEKLWSLRNEINRDSRFVITRTEKGKNYHHRVMQLVDIQTTFIHARNANEDIEHGVYIDIIPMDACAPSKIGYCHQVLNAMLFSVYNIQCLPEYNDGKVVSKLTEIALKLVKSPEKRYRIWKHCEKQITKYDWTSAKAIAFLCCDVKGLLHLCDASWFSNVKKHKFEDIDINIPIEAEKYLTYIFGDYMQLPPEESRHPGHKTKLIDLEKPYIQYKGKYYCVKE